MNKHLFAELAHSWNRTGPCHWLWWICWSAY